VTATAATTVVLVAAMMTELYVVNAVSMSGMTRDKLCGCHKITQQSLFLMWLLVQKRQGMSTKL
jgi:hypothetical protein